MNQNGHATAQLDFNHVLGSLGANLENLRADVIEKDAHIRDLETRLAMMESENACLRAQLAEEQAKRDYYQRFAVEVATAMNLVGQVCDDAFQKAQNGAYGKPAVAGAPPRQIPELKIPEFLKRGPAGGEAAAPAEGEC